MRTETTKQGVGARREGVVVEGPRTLNLVLGGHLPTAPERVFDTPLRVLDTPVRVLDTPLPVLDTPLRVLHKPGRVLDTPQKPSGVTDTRLGGF